MAKRPTIDSIDTALARWKTRLKRAVTAIDKLEKQRKRLTVKAAAPPPPPKLPEAVADQIAGYHPDQSEAERIKRGALPPKKPEPKPEPDLSIPEFLRRGAAAQKAVDEVIADQIRTEQAETKKAKSRGRIEKLKAKKSGELKKMPLTGKAALDHIRNG